MGPAFRRLLASTCTLALVGLSLGACGDDSASVSTERVAVHEWVERACSKLVDAAEDVVASVDEDDVAAARSDEPDGASFEALEASVLAFQRYVIMSVDAFGDAGFPEVEALADVTDEEWVRTLEAWKDTLAVQERRQRDLFDEVDVDEIDADGVARLQEDLGDIDTETSERLADEVDPVFQGASGGVGNDEIGAAFDANDACRRVEEILEPL